MATIEKGKTTKEEIIKLLGQPSSKTIMTYAMPEIDTKAYGGVKIDLSKSMPYETWAYSKVVMDDRPFMKNLALYALGGGYVPPSQVISLAINFDKSGIVQSYSMVETQ